MAFALAFQDHQESGVAGQNKSYAGLNFGTAFADRILLALMGCRAGAGTLAIQSVAIGGTAFTQVVGAANVDGSSIMIDGWYLQDNGSKGTSGQIDIDWGNATDRSGIEVFSITGGATTPSAVQVIGGTTDTIALGAITVPSGGGAATYFLNRGGTGTNPTTWSANVTSDFTAGAHGGGGDSDISGGHANTTGSLLITATNTQNNGSNTGLLAIAWDAGAGATAVLQSQIWM